MCEISEVVLLKLDSIRKSIVEECIKELNCLGWNNVDVAMSIFKPWWYTITGENRLQQWPEIWFDIEAKKEGEQKHKSFLCDSLFLMWDSKNVDQWAAQKVAQWAAQKFVEDYKE